MQENLTPDPQQAQAQLIKSQLSQISIKLSDYVWQHREDPQLIDLLGLISNWIINQMRQTGNIEHIGKVQQIQQILHIPVNQTPYNSERCFKCGILASEYVRVEWSMDTDGVDYVCKDCYTTRYCCNSCRNDKLPTTVTTLSECCCSQLSSY